jgi:hypothetical protein
MAMFNSKKASKPVSFKSLPNLQVLNFTYVVSLSTKFISVIEFGKELDKTRESSESRSFKRQLPSSVLPSQRGSPANRKVFRTGFLATTSKSSPRKALFSSV